MREKKTINNSDYLSILEAAIRVRKENLLRLKRARIVSLREYKKIKDEITTLQTEIAAIFGKDGRVLVYENKGRFTLIYGLPMSKKAEGLS